MGLESLSDILKGPSSAPEPVAEPADAKPAEPVATAAAPATPSVVKDEASADPAEKPTQRNEKGQFVKSESEPEKPAVTREVAGQIDERKKRQAAEAELRELRQASAKQAETPKVSVFENEDKALSNATRREMSPITQRLVDQSLRIAKLTFGDEFDRSLSAFNAEARKNPGLIQQMENASDPGQFVFDAGYWFSEMEPHGGSLSRRDEAKFGEFKTQVAERDNRIKALESELQLAKKSQAELEAVPTSLNRQASAGLSRGESTDADDLRSIVRFGNNTR